MEDRREDLETNIRNNTQLLVQTDYKALKHSEGQISDEDYAETKAMRQKWRDEINEWQDELDNLND